MAQLTGGSRTIRLTRRHQEWLQGYTFITPAIIVLGIFLVLAVVFVIYLSFHSVNLFTRTYDFVGISNFARLTSDTMAMRAIGTALLFRR